MFIITTHLQRICKKHCKLISTFNRFSKCHSNYSTWKYTHGFPCSFPLCNFFKNPHYSNVHFGSKVWWKTFIKTNSCARQPFICWFHIQNLLAQHTHIKHLLRNGVIHAKIVCKYCLWSGTRRNTNATYYIEPSSTFAFRVKTQKVWIRIMFATNPNRVMFIRKDERVQFFLGAISIWCLTHIK